MAKKLLWEATRRVSAQGNSACLLIPYKLKKGLLKENRSQGTWLCYKEKDGSLTMEVKFKILEKTETEKETKTPIRTKLKPEVHIHKDEWTTQGECEVCGQVANLYTKGEKHVCRNCR